MRKIIEKYWTNNKAAKDFATIFAIGFITFILSYFFDGYKAIYNLTDIYGYQILGDILVSMIVMSVAMFVINFAKWKELKWEITERRRAVKTMQKSRSQLKAVLDSLPDMILQLDRNMRILWANEMAYKMNPDLIGRYSYQALSYKQGTFIDAYCKWAMELKQIEKGIMYRPDMIGVDGVSYWETIGVPLMNRDGTVYGSIAIARDITKRMKLEHTWNLLSSIVESTDDAIYGVSWDSVILNWNAGAEKTYGYTAAEIVGKPFSILVPVELRNEINDSIERVAKKEVIERYETTRIMKGGKSIIVSSVMTPFVDATGKKIGISAIDRDITESKAAEAALKESEHFNKTIISSIKEGLFVIDEDMRFKEWNKSMEEITGMKAEDVIGADVKKSLAFLNKDKVTELFQRALNGIPIDSFEFPFKPNISSNERWFNVSLSTHISAGGKIIGVVGTLREITDQKLAEKALQESEGRFRQMANTIQDAFWLTDRINQDVLFISPGYERIWGRSPDKLYENPKDWLEAIHPEDRDRVNSASMSIVQNDGMDEEFRVVHSDGAVTWVRDRRFPIKDELGNIYRVSGITQDVTIRKAAENALRKERDFAQSLIDNAQAIVLVLDMQGRIVQFNTYTEDITGFKLEQVKNKKWIDIFVADSDKERIQKLFEEAVSTGVIANASNSIVTKKGKILTIQWSDEILRDLDGKMIGVLAIGQDITERIFAEDALRKSEEKFRTLVITAPDGIVLTDGNGIIIEANRAISQIFGYNRRDTLGKTLFELLQQDDNKEKYDINNLFSNNSTFSQEMHVVDKKGHDIPIEISVSALHGENSGIVGLIAIIRDISERKAFENELKTSREQMRNLAIHLQTVREEERKHIAFEIHDELGYALTALKLELSWFVKKLNIEDDKMVTRTDEMLALIDTTIQKVRSISSQLRPSILDHFGLAAAIDWQAKEFQKRTAVRCKTDITAEEVKINDHISTAVFRIFQETLTNTARHSKATRVDVKFTLTSEKIILRVKDNGKGISKDQMTSLKSLGLISMRERANTIGGIIDIKGVPNIGTTVTLKVNIINQGEQK